MRCVNFVVQEEGASVLGHPLLTTDSSTKREGEYGGRRCASLSISLLDTSNETSEIRARDDLQI